MKQLMYTGVLAVLVCLISCKKNKSAEVIYEVSLVGATTWHGTYFNENGQVIGVTNAPSGWKYSFKNDKNLVVVSVTAYADGTDPLAAASKKIYVNGKVMAIGTYGSSPQLQYQFP